MIRFTRSSSRRSWAEIEAKLATILADIDDDHRDIVRMRWLDVAMRYDRLWRDHRLAYYWFRVPTIVGAATVPVLAGLSVPRVATALVGLVVAVLTGLDSFFHYGLRWQQQRRAAAAIEFEGWQFLELSGPYATHASHADVYTLFLGRLEAINERLSTTYLDLFRDDGTNPRQHSSVPT